MAKKSVWDINFASNKQVRERIEAYFIQKCKQVRYQRYRLEQDWMRFFNMWNVTKDGFHSYNGRAQLYIPQVRKDVEAQSRQLTQSAFPTSDFFDVSPGQTGTRRGAQAWKSVHTWAMKECKIRLSYHVAMRQQCLYGTSPIYLPWKRIERGQFINVKQGKNSKITPKRMSQILFNGPDFVVKDLFKWYALNPSKPNFQEDGCFEEEILDRYDIMYRAKSEDLTNLKEILEGATNAYHQEELERDIERMEAIGITLDPTQGYSGEAEIAGVVDEDGSEKDNTYLCTKIYTDFVLPEACDEGEDPQMPIALEIKLYNNQVAGSIRRNPFYHQQAPYVCGKYILPNPNEFYGQGIPWATQYMQYELNSKAEQCMDSTTLALNPITIVDPGLAGSGEEFNVEPGAKWFANPQGVKMTAIPDVSPVGYQAMTQITAQMENFADRSPALPPQLLGKSRTATQSQIVENSLSTDNTTFQLQNELLILEPMLDQWEFLMNQNMDEKQIIMLLGRRASDLKRTMVSKADLLGRYSYDWKVASTLQNRQILGRQMLDAFKTAMMLPPQIQSQLNLNFAEFFKILWDQAWQLPDADKIIGMPEEMVSQDWNAENEMAKLELELEVLPGDDDQAHMQGHDQAVKDEKAQEVKEALMSHIMDHQKQAQRKQAAQQAAQQQQKMQMMMMMMAQQQQGGKRQGGAGNRTQLSPNLSAGDQGSGVRA